MNSSRENNKTTACDSSRSSEPQTVLDHVEQLYKKVDNIEKTLGSLTKNGQREEQKVFTIEKSGKSGIDVVLGGQWGDEGKGKLVDILSQVGPFLFFLSFRKTCLFTRRYTTIPKNHEPKFVIYSHYAHIFFLLEIGI